MQDLWAQFKALADIEDEDDHDLKAGQLWAEHRKRVAAAQPHPKCCFYGARLFASADLEHPDRAPIFGVSVRDEMHGSMWHPIKFCPWCAAPMPELVHAPQPGEHYMTCTDSGYYCDECGQRLHDCYCLRRECAWKVRQ